MSIYILMYFNIVKPTIICFFVFVAIAIPPTAMYNGALDDYCRWFIEVI